MPGTAVSICSTLLFASESSCFSLLDSLSVVSCSEYDVVRLANRSVFSFCSCSSWYFNSEISVFRVVYSNSCSSFCCSVLGSLPPHVHLFNSSLSAVFSASSCVHVPCRRERGEWLQDDKASNFKDHCMAVSGVLFLPALFSQSVPYLISTFCQ